MKTTALALAALLSLPAAAAVAATPSRAPAKPSPDAPREIAFRLGGDKAERDLALKLYDRDIRTLVGAAVSTATVDVDGDGVGEVAVRFSSAPSCGPTGCQTAIARFNGTAWEEIFRRRANTIALAPTSTGGKRDLVLNGGEEVWKWDGTQYMLDTASIGQELLFDSRTERDGSPALLAAVSAALRVAPGALQGTLVSYKIDLNDDGVPETAVYVKSRDLCSPADGCHVLVFGDLSRPPLFDGMTIENAWITNRKVDGLKGVMVNVPKGSDTYHWDGKRFSLSATSYPSKTTPRP